MVVPLGQFGKGNSNLIRSEVDSSGSRTVSEEKNIHYPFSGSVSKAEYGKPYSLKAGVTYSISKKTPLMPSFNSLNPMKAIGNTKHLHKGSLIKVVLS